MFELPSQTNIDEVVINEDVVLKDKKPLTVHSKNKNSISQTIS
jgi:ATP-dependent protease Clp ATPase subunit